LHEGQQMRAFAVKLVRRRRLGARRVPQPQEVDRLRRVDRIGSRLREGRDELLSRPSEAIVRRTAR
jgi:hypothetical protein